MSNALRNLHLDKWWSPKTLVDAYPAEHWNYQYAYLGLLGLLLVTVIALALMKKVRFSLKDRVYSLAWTNIIIGLILYFFRQQRVPILGMDLWRFLQELAIVGWIIVIIRFYLSTYRKEALLQKVEERRNKYLPKAKNK